MSAASPPGPPHRGSGACGYRCRGGPWPCRSPRLRRPAGAHGEPAPATPRRAPGTAWRRCWNSLPGSPASDPRDRRCTVVTLPGGARQHPAPRAAFRAKLRCMSADTPRRIVLLRHAKAEWSRESDHERPLAERGRQDAPAAGRRLAHSGTAPDLALCSTATRTRETWKLAVPRIRAAPQDRVRGAALRGLPRRTASPCSTRPPTTCATCWSSATTPVCTVPRTRSRARPRATALARLTEAASRPRPWPWSSSPARGSPWSTASAARRVLDAARLSHDRATGAPAQQLVPGPLRRAVSPPGRRPPRPLRG